MTSKKLQNIFRYLFIKTQSTNVVQYFGDFIGDPGVSPPGPTNPRPGPPIQAAGTPAAMVLGAGAGIDVPGAGGGGT